MCLRHIRHLYLEKLTFPVSKDLLGRSLQSHGYGLGPSKFELKNTALTQSPDPASIQDSERPDS